MVVFPVNIVDFYTSSHGALVLMAWQFFTCFFELRCSLSFFHLSFNMAIIASFCTMVCKSQVFLIRLAIFCLWVLGRHTRLGWGEKGRQFISYLNFSPMMLESAPPCFPMAISWSNSRQKARWRRWGDGGEGNV